MLFDNVYPFQNGGELHPLVYIWRQPSCIYFLAAMASNNLCIEQIMQKCCEENMNNCKNIHNLFLVDII